MADKYYAAIDLGTNSCRLLIVNQKGKVAYQDSIPVWLFVYTGITYLMLSCKILYEFISQSPSSFYMNTFYTD